MTQDTDGMQSSEDDARIAANLRMFRSTRGLTLSRLSELSGISVGHLSRLENGERTPTVRTMLQLARAYGVSLGELAGESVGDRGPHVSREGERSALSLHGASLRTLSDPSSHMLQAIELVLEPGRKGDPAVHAGEEWIFILQGAIEAIVADRVITLQAGEALHFRADEPHSLRNLGSSQARALVVSASPSTGLHLDF